MQNEATKSGNNKINLLNLKEVVSVINGIQKEEILKIKFVLPSKESSTVQTDNFFNYFSYFLKKLAK